MKKVGIPVKSTSDLVLEVDSVDYSSYGYSVEDFVNYVSGFWVETDRECNPNLCTEIPDATPSITAELNDGSSAYPTESQDFVFIGQMPKERPW